MEEAFLYSPKLTTSTAMAFLPELRCKAISRVS
jgi:hypothetical protein